MIVSIEFKVNSMINFMEKCGHWVQQMDQAIFMPSANLIGDYRQTSNISHTLVGNKIVDHSDVVGTPPASAAPTTASFST